MLRIWYPFWPCYWLCYIFFFPCRIIQESRTADSICICDSDMWQLLATCREARTRSICFDQAAYGEHRWVNTPDPRHRTAPHTNGSFPNTQCWTVSLYVLAVAGKAVKKFKSLNLLHFNFQTNRMNIFLSNLKSSVYPLRRFVCPCDFLMCAGCTRTVPHVMYSPFPPSSSTLYLGLSRATTDSW